MAVIYVLPCMALDLAEGKAEVYGTRIEAQEACSRCFKLDRTCPRRMSERLVKRMYVCGTPASRPQVLKPEDSNHGQEVTS